jgi:hypothetical protein
MRQRRRELQVLPQGDTLPTHRALFLVTAQEHLSQLVDQRAAGRGQWWVAAPWRCQRDLPKPCPEPADVESWLCHAKSVEVDERNPGIAAVCAVPGLADQDLGGSERPMRRTGRLAGHVAGTLFQGGDELVGNASHRRHSQRQTTHGPGHPIQQLRRVAFPTVPDVTRM